MHLGQRIRHDEKINIGANIRRIRLKRNIGQKEMAEKLQLRKIPMLRETYVKIERGIRNVGASELKAIKEILETTYDELLKETEHTKEK